MSLWKRAGSQAESKAFENSIVGGLPARWCSGERFRIVVGRPGVHSLSRVIPKDFTKWYSQLPCLALSIKKV